MVTVISPSCIKQTSHVDVSAAVMRCCHILIALACRYPRLLRQTGSLGRVYNITLSPTAETVARVISETLSLVYPRNFLLDIYTNVLNLLEPVGQRCMSARAVSYAVAQCGDYISTI